MKLFLGSVLALAIASSPLLARQEPQDDKDKPKQEEPKPKTEAKPKPEEKPKQEPAPNDKAKPKQEPQPKPDEKQQQKADKEKQTRNEKQQPEANRPAQQKQSAQGGQGRGQRIPEERYRASFGKEHHFRVQRGEQRFQYGGYWFEAQAWPAGWVFDDDCYIVEEGDSYFLVDMVHPDMRVAVIVVQG